MVQRVQTNEDCKLHSVAVKTEEICYSVFHIHLPRVEVSWNLTNMWKLCHKAMTLPYFSWGTGSDKSDLSWGFVCIMRVVLAVLKHITQSKVAFLSFVQASILWLYLGVVLVLPLFSVYWILWNYHINSFCSLCPSTQSDLWEAVVSYSTDVTWYRLLYGTILFKHICGVRHVIV